MLESNSLQNEVIFLYYALLDDPTISPTIENQLNYSKIKTIADIVGIVNSDGFSFTTRLIKFVLSSNRVDMLYFLNHFSDEKGKLILLELYVLAISNKYDSIDLYKLNLNSIFFACKNTPYAPQ